MVDIAGISAVLQAEKYRNFEPLIELFESGSRFVVEDPRARALLVAKLRGEKKKGRPPKSEEDETISKWMASLAWYYHGQGMPKHNDEEASKNVSACSKTSEILSEYVHAVSQSTVRAAMNEHEDYYQCKIAYQCGKAGYKLEHPVEALNWRLTREIMKMREGRAPL